MIDRFGRRIHNLRISVTDRCNFRCMYCMPAKSRFRPSAENLTSDEILRMVRLAVKLGFTDFRVTGGEPLVRPGILGFLGDLVRTEGVRRVAITTNGHLLGKHLEDLAGAGVRSINLSVDSLRADRFREMSRGGDPEPVWDAMRRAAADPRFHLKVNAVVMGGVNDDEIEDLAALTLSHDLDVRFIEFMPFGYWDKAAPGAVVPAEEIERRLRARFGMEEAATDEKDSGPASYLKLKGARGRVGLIQPVSDKFCKDCNRMRLTADGRLKVEKGGRLSREDGLLLYAHPDLTAVGEMANARAEAMHGRAVGYNVNRHINYSNICKLSCMFCSFAKKLVDEKGIGYQFSMDQILARAKEAADAGADEVHIVGGLHPDYPYDYYPAMLRAIRAAYPVLHLKAFTAVEIDYFAGLAGKSVEWVLGDLREAGLGSLPGGGAEVLSDRVHRKIFRDKMPPRRWLEVHEQAHRMGIKSNSTLLYGHIEREDEKVDHLLQLRALQDRTSGFMTFIPLRFHNEYNQLQNIPMVRAVHSLREIAVGRLMLDNVPHVKSYWIMMGLETAQLCLQYGADDIDGTVVEEKITHMAGGTTPEGLDEEHLRLLIREAGKEPFRRDTLYNRVPSKFDR